MERMMKILIFLVALMVFQSGFAQDRIKLIEGASSLTAGKKDGEQFNKFIRSQGKQLYFLHQNTRIYCDTAILFKKTNTVEAYGRVLINDNDSIRITSDSLLYDGNERVARLRGNVVLSDDSVTLYTNYLDYYRDNRLAQYYDGGRLIDSENRLTSVKGYYQTASKIMSFKDSVVLINPEYTLYTDTLVYNTQSEVASTFGPTEIVSREGNTVDAQATFYDTRRQVTRMTRGTIETEEYILSGDKLKFDDSLRVYLADVNVTLVSKENDLVITGDHAISDQNTGETRVFENAVMKKLVGEDSLFLNADTLISIEDSIPANERVLAYPGVKIFKSDLQGIADSLAYFLSDSVIRFYQDPVLWSGDNQMTADSINIFIVNNEIDHMEMNYNSFVIQLDTLKNFNQIKGRRMLAQFDSSNIKQVDVYGNGESLFHALEADSIMVGMNKILCSNMLIVFNGNQAEEISFYVNPEASFIPPHEMNEEISRLKGFNWRNEERPTKQRVVFPFLFNAEKPEPEKELKIPSASNDQ